MVYMNKIYLFFGFIKNHSSHLKSAKHDQKQYTTTTSYTVNLTKKHLPGLTF